MPLATLLLASLFVMPMTGANTPLNVAWDECYGAGGAGARTFACDTDAGVEVLVGSVIVPGGVTELNGMEPTLIVRFGIYGADIPPWWTFGNAPNCRPLTSLASAFPGTGVPGGCNTYFRDRNAAGAHVADVHPLDPQQVRIRMVAAIDNDLRGPVTAGEELYLFTLTIDHARTTGPSACAGCDVEACISFSSLTLTQPAGVGDFTWSANTAQDHGAEWQNGFCGIVPARNATWGRVKSLYR